MRLKTIRKYKQKKKKKTCNKHKKKIKNKNLMLPMIINSLLFTNSRISTNEFRLYWLVMASFIKRDKGLGKGHGLLNKIKMIHS